MSKPARKRSWNYKGHLRMMAELQRLQKGLEKGAYTAGDVSNIERCLSNVITGASYLVGYALARGAAGCGDGGHETGVKEGKSLQKRVRKAMGYVRP